MGSFLVFIYFVLFAVIAGGAFAMMWSSIQSINEGMTTLRRHQHPEAPKKGEEVMYVDLNRDRLENLYNDQR